MTLEQARDRLRNVLRLRDQLEEQREQVTHRLEGVRMAISALEADLAAWKDDSAEAKP